MSKSSRIVLYGSGEEIEIPDNSLVLVRTSQAVTINSLPIIGEFDYVDHPMMDDEERNPNVHLLILKPPALRLLVPGRYGPRYPVSPCGSIGVKNPRGLNLRNPRELFVGKEEIIKALRDVKFYSDLKTHRNWISRLSPPYEPKLRKRLEKMAS